jgi:hypothetical protein
MSLARSELAPCSQCVVYITKLQCARKIIAATVRDDEHGELQFDQLRQMTVHGAISAKNQDGIGIRWVRGQPELPDCIRISCERIQMLGRGTQPKNGGNSHFAARD